MRIPGGAELSTRLHTNRFLRTPLKTNWVPEDQNFNTRSVRFSILTEGESFSSLFTNVRKKYRQGYECFFFHVDFGKFVDKFEYRIGQNVDLILSVINFQYSVILMWKRFNIKSHKSKTLAIDSRYGFEFLMVISFGKLLCFSFYFVFFFFFYTRYHFVYMGSNDISLLVYTRDSILYITSFPRTGVVLDIGIRRRRRRCRYCRSPRARLCIYHNIRCAKCG